MKHLLRKLSAIICVALMPCLSTMAVDKDFTQFVNPWIGTGGHGHVFLGANVPFGLVQLLAVVLCRSCGVEMMVWVFTIVNVLWVLPWWYQVRRLIGLTLREFLSDVLLFTAIAALSMLVACQVALLSDGLAATLAIKVAVAAVLYFAILWLIGARILRESIEELLALLRKR